MKNFEFKLIPTNVETPTTNDYTIENLRFKLFLILIFNYQFPTTNDAKFITQQTDKILPF